jgi:hypothetical protein
MLIDDTSDLCDPFLHIVWKGMYLCSSFCFCIVVRGFLRLEKPQQRDESDKENDRNKFDLRSDETMIDSFLNFYVCACWLMKIITFDEDDDKVQW